MGSYETIIIWSEIDLLTLKDDYLTNGRREKYYMITTNINPYNRSKFALRPTVEIQNMTIKWLKNQKMDN